MEAADNEKGHQRKDNEKHREEFSLEDKRTVINKLLYPTSGHFSVPTIYFRLPHLTIQEQMVLIVMHSYSNPRGGTSIVNRDQFAKECRMTPKEVKQALASLKKRGLYHHFIDSLELTGDSKPAIQTPEVNDYDAVRYYAPDFGSQQLEQQIDSVTPEQAKEARTMLEKKDCERGMRDEILPWFLTGPSPSHGGCFFCFVLFVSTGDLICIFRKSPAINTK